MREWEERGSRRKEARERDERVSVEDRLGNLRTISEEEVRAGLEEPKKRRKGVEGVISAVATLTPSSETPSRPLSVEQRCELLVLDFS